MNLKMKIANVFNRSGLSCNDNLMINQDLRKLWNDYEELKEKSKNYNTKLKTLTLKVLGLSVYDSQKRNSRNLKNSKDKKFYKKSNTKSIRDNELKKAMENVLFLSLKAIQVTEQLYEDIDDLKELFLKSRNFITKGQNEGLKLINCDRKITCIKSNKFDDFYENSNIMHKVHFNSESFFTYLTSQFIKKSNVETKPNNTQLVIACKPEKSVDNESCHLQKPGFSNEEKHITHILKIITQLLKPHIIFVDHNYISNTVITTLQGKRISPNLMLKEPYSFIDVSFRKNTSTSDIMEESSRKTKSIRSVQPIELRSITNVPFKKSDIGSAALPHLNLMIDGYYFFTGDFKKLFTTSPVPTFDEITFNNFDSLEETLKKKIENEQISQLPVTRIKDENKYFDIAIEEKFDHYLSQIRYNLQIEKPFQTTQQVLITEIDKALEVNNLPNITKSNVSEKNEYPTLSFCKKSQTDNSRYLQTTEINLDSAIKIESSCNEKIDRMKNASNETFSMKTASNVGDKHNDSHHNFKNSLRNLEKVIQQCKKSSEQESTSKPRAFLKSQNKKKSLMNEDLLFHTDKNLNLKKKNQQNNRNVNKKEYATFTMPEMGKKHQIVLQNKISQGVKLQFITYNKANVQILMLSSPQIAGNSSKIKRKKF